MIERLSNPLLDHELKGKLQCSLLAASLMVASSCSIHRSSDGFSGGCPKFAVYSQDRYPPLGTAVRAEPDALSTKLEPGFAGNEVIAVNGWVHSKPAYPTNPPPWNSDIWFHLANRTGWVSFAGVRGDKTAPDPSGGLSPDGGQPAPTTSQCEAKFKP